MKKSKLFQTSGLALLTMAMSIPAWAASLDGIELRMAKSGTGTCYVIGATEDETYPISGSDFYSEGGFGYFNGQILTNQSGTQYVYDLDYNMLDSYGVSGYQTFYAKGQDPTSGLIFGVIKNGSARSYGSVDYVNDQLNAIYDFHGYNQRPYAIAVNQNGRIYAVTRAGNFVEINRDNGHQTQIGYTGQMVTYLTDGTIDPKSNRFFFVVDNDWDHGLYEVNLTNGQATLVGDWNNTGNAGQWYSMHTPYVEYANVVPARINDLAVSFSNNATSGTITFTMPEGDEATYHVLLNDVEKYSADAAGGAGISIPADVTPGDYVVTVYASNPMGEGPRAAACLHSGNPTPSMTRVVAGVEGNNVVLTWAPVVIATDDSSLAGQTITYTVTNALTNEVVATTTETTAKVAAGDDNLFNVVATCNGTSSTPSYANEVKLAEAIVAPMEKVFDDFTSIMGWITIDANNDNNWIGTLTNGVVFPPNSKTDGDDWLVSPSIKLLPNHKYTISMECETSGGTETMEMKAGFGPDPIAFTETVVEPTEFTGKSTLSGELVTKAGGLYNFGIHYASPVNSGTVYLYNLKIEDNGEQAVEYNYAATVEVLTPRVQGVPDQWLQGVKVKITNTGKNPITNIMRHWENLDHDGNGNGWDRNFDPAIQPGESVECDMWNMMCSASLEDGLYHGQFFLESAEDEEYDFENPIEERTGNFEFTVGNVAEGIVPPYFNNFTADDAIEGWTLIDGNGDDDLWTQEDGYLKAPYNDDIPMDDWIFTPAFSFEGGMFYPFSVDVRINKEVYAPEKMEILYGTEPTVEGMTQQIMEPTEFSSNTWATYSYTLAPATTGLYYIGLHCITDPDKTQLHVTNFTVGAPTTTGINSILGNDTKAVYYDLMGRMVANPQHGIFIRKTGNKATKVIL